MLVILCFLICGYVIVRMIDIVTRKPEPSMVLHAAAVLMIFGALVAGFLVYRASRQVSDALAPAYEVPTP